MPVSVRFQHAFVRVLKGYMYAYVCSTGACVRVLNGRTCASAYSACGRVCVRAHMGGGMGAQGEELAEQLQASKPLTQTAAGAGGGGGADGGEKADSKSESKNESKESKNESKVCRGRYSEQELQVFVCSSVFKNAGNLKHT